MSIVYFDSSAFVKLLLDEFGSDLTAALWNACDGAVSSLATHARINSFGFIETPYRKAVDGVTVGCSICYDIRFPALFEALGSAHCDVIAIPAAFTVPTGAAHWHVLQRARAIEASG